MNDEMRNIHKYMDLFGIIANAIPTEEYNMLDIMRAAEFLIADCIAQSNVSQELEEKTYASIAEDIKNFATSFKQQYQQIETTTHATKEQDESENVNIEPMEEKQWKSKSNNI